MIVPATPQDAAVMGAIHAMSFASPWTSADFATFLQHSGIAGWITGANAPEAFILIRRVAEEAEILTIAVIPPARRRGYARALLTHALEELRSRGTATCFLEVAMENDAAQALYASHGFASFGKRRGYYERAGTASGDAIVMRRDL